MLKKSVCIFPGSFAPFHEGHFYIVKKCLRKYFKKIYIVVSHNENKQWHDLNLAKKQIMNFLQNKNIDQNKIIIVINEGLTTDIMREFNIRWIIRGYRNKLDWEYEKQMYSKYLSFDSQIKYKLIKSSKKLQFIESRKFIHKNKI